MDYRTDRGVAVIGCVLSLVECGSRREALSYASAVACLP
jgi:hypothetical protein